MLSEIKHMLIYFMWYLKNGNTGYFKSYFHEKIIGVSIQSSMLQGEMQKRDYGDFFVLKHKMCDKKCLLFVKPHVDFLDFVGKAACFENIFAIFKLGYDDLENIKSRRYGNCSNPKKNNKIYRNAENSNFVGGETVTENGIVYEKNYKYFGFSSDFFPIKTETQKKRFLNGYYSLMVNYLLNNLEWAKTPTTSYEYLNKIIGNLSKKTYPFSIFLLNNMQSQEFYSFSPGQCKFVVCRGVEAYVNIILFILTFIIIVCLYMLFKIWVAAQPVTPLITPTELDCCKVAHFKDILPRKFTNCIICLADFEENSVCRILNCNHYFHKRCVDPWLKNLAAQCPYCRNLVKFVI